MHAETLKARLLKIELPTVEEGSHHLRDIINGMRRGEFTQTDIHLEILIALKHGYGRVTFGNFIEVLRGEYNDPLFQDIALAFEQIAASPHLQHVATQKLKPGSITLGHLLMGAALVDVIRWCESDLSKTDIQKLQKEADATSQTWQGYLQDQAIRWMKK